jgi:hypothetical protein
MKFFIQHEILLHAKRRGERGGYELLNVRVVCWVNPRLFLVCSGTALDSKKEKEEDDASYFRRN